MVWVAATVWAQQAPYETPPGHADFIHMRLELALSDEDIAARRMHGVVRYWVRPKPGADAALRELSLDAIGLEIEAVELAGPTPMPVWSYRHPPPPGWAAPQADALSRGLTWRDVEYRYDDAQLVIPLDPQVGDGETCWVRVRYAVEAPPLGLHFVFPDADHPDRPTAVYSQAEPLEARYWLPCRDWPDTRWASDLLITVPEQYSAVSVGDPVEATDSSRLKAQGSPPTRTFHWRQPYPIDPHLLGFAVGEFETIEFDAVSTQVLDKPRVRVFAYVSPGFADEARYSFRRVPEMIHYYSELLGVPFPFGRYGHVTIPNHFHGGMEHAGFSMIDPALLTSGPRGHVLEETAEYNYIAHMLAHEWFAGIVTNRHLREAWLNEGFATYMHQLWRVRAESHDAFIEDMVQTARRITLTDRVGGEPIINPDLHSPEDVYRFGGGRIYWKGAWVLHMLRHELGDEPFWRAVQQYLQRHRRVGCTQTSDLRAAFEEVAERDLGAFFDQWVYRSGVPELEVRYRWSADAGQVAVEVAQLQTIDEHNPPFRFPLDLYFRSRDGVRRVTVTIDATEQSFDFPMASEPTVFCVDPDAGLLATISQEKPATLWHNQVRGGPTALTRSRAVDELKTPEGRTALGLVREALLDTREFHGVRRQAAAVLPRLGDPDAALAALLEAERTAGASDERLLVAIVNALDGFSGSADAQAAVLRRAGDDQTPRVRAAAVAALVKFDPDVRPADTVVALAKAAGPGVSRLVRQAAFESLDVVRDPTVLDHLLPALHAEPAAERDATPVGTIRALTRVIVDTCGDDRRAQSRATDYLMILLADRRPGVRRAAVQALARVGDETALPRLEVLSESDPAEPVRRAASAAIAEVQERLEPTPG